MQTVLAMSPNGWLNASLATFLVSLLGHVVACSAALRLTEIVLRLDAMEFIQTGTTFEQLRSRTNALGHWLRSPDRVILGSLVPRSLVLGSRRSTWIPWLDSGWKIATSDNIVTVINGVPAVVDMHCLIKAVLCDRT
jgi:hypothetical protein